ncbi:hypothetical protein CPSG_05146 [Coccidioides posadasii str. Silveira]|uniref:Uncharacterized protein n=1 Tax=Coccidioides posadasii (strain RMSCC 757 / Silveira) TaxID=443226 RepID=E9D4M8_COCPS|nr:hypothetical protein CPSG_05146 [Coccidioides posadasii str. Silveira]
MAGLCPSNLHVETPIPSMRFEMEMLTARVSELIARCENYPAYYEGPILISRSSEGANSRQSSGGLGRMYGLYGGRPFCLNGVGHAKSESQTAKEYDDDS